MEFCGGGSLMGLLKSVVYLSEGQLLGTLQQITDGLAFLHGHHVIHRDIKPHNILLTEDGRWAPAGPPDRRTAASLAVLVLCMASLHAVCAAGVFPCPPA
eukprot:gene5135-biopygen4579